MNCEALKIELRVRLSCAVKGATPLRRYADALGGVRTTLLQDFRTKRVHDSDRTTLLQDFRTKRVSRVRRKRQNRNPLKFRRHPRPR